MCIPFHVGALQPFETFPSIIDSVKHFHEYLQYITFEICILKHNQLAYHLTQQGFTHLSD